MRFLHPSFFNSLNYGWAYHTLAKLGLGQTHTVFEIGSWDAKDAISIAKTFKCKVEVFEPSSSNFLICTENIALAGKTLSSKIQLHELAVSDECGVVDFFEVDSNLYENSGASSLFEINFKNRSQTDPDFNRDSVQFKRKVKAICLDHYLEQFEERIDSLAILIDTQGAEQKVLNGMIKNLHRFNIIILEGSGIPNYVGAPTIEEIHKFLITKGYSLMQTQFFNGQLAGTVAIDESVARYMAAENNYLYIKNELSQF